MIHTWSGQTKEEYLEECRRDKALTPEQRKKEWNEIIEASNKKSINNTIYTESNDAEWTYIHAEKPNSLDNGEAAVSWIIIMLIGAIFNARWFIWIVATIIYLRHINRYVIRKAKWDSGGKEEYYQKIKNTFKENK